MSLVYCPECGHEISQNAVACPNCGRPISARPPVVEKTPVATVAPVVRRQEGVPPWAFVLFGVLGILVVVILFLLFRGSGDDSNVNVAINANRRLAEANRDVRTTALPPSEPQTVTVPGSQTSAPSVPSTATTVPGTTTAAPVAPPAGTSDRGTVAIRARIVNARGTAQPARSTRFYLLDKDLETVLNEAHVEPIEGNSLASSIGLAAVHPDQYGEFQRAAMRAIGAHAKYSGTTDATGAAKLGNIAPKEYYLFAITKVGNGFALWNSPVSVVPGENVMDLSPASVTEIEG